MHFMSDDEIRAVSGLLLGGLFVPYSALFFSMWAMGRIITPDEERSALGLWFGRFVATIGWVMLCVSILTLSRWSDMHPDAGGPAWLGTLVTGVGVIALLSGIPVFFRLVPLIRVEFRKAAEAGLVRASVRPLTERETAMTGREGAMSGREDAMGNREDAMSRREHPTDG